MRTIKNVKDPVCLMELNPDEAVESEDYLQHRYYFCNPQCHKTFQLDPEPYVKRLVR